MTAQRQRQQRSPGWRIGHLRGVPVYLGRSWVIVAGVIVVIFGPVVARGLPSLGPLAYAVALLFALLLLVSVMVHEAAHALVGQACGYRISRVVADFWGGHTAYDSRDATPGRSALVAIAGPAANAALAGLGWLAGQATGPLTAPMAGQAGSGVVELLLVAFTWSNTFVAVFNLLPGLPLDGGFLVDSAVWKATGSRALGMLVAGWCGRLLTLALVWWAVVMPFLNGQSPSLTRLLYAVLIGSFLWLGASEAVTVGRARRRLERVSIAQVQRPVATVPAGTPLDQLRGADSHLIHVAVDGSGWPLGLVDPVAAARVPQQAWAHTPVQAIVQYQPRDWVVVAEPDDPLTEIVIAMQTHHLGVVAVQGRQGLLHGVVQATDLEPRRP